MDKKEMKPLEKTMAEFNVFLKDPKIREILKLCIQLNSKNNFKDILLKISDEFKECVSQSGDFCEFDFICMFALNYIYENDIKASLSAVSRSLYLYVQQIHFPWSDIGQVPYIKCNRNRILKELRKIDTLYTYSKCEELLVDIGLCSILCGNVGLSYFLVKFGFVVFPVELNEKGIKMTEVLVNTFNGTFHHPLKHIQEEERRTTIELDKLLNLMQHSNFDFRRFLLIFCTIVLISEYSLYQKVETNARLHSFNEIMRRICLAKFACLNLFIETTNETKSTLADIDKFIATFINPLLNEDAGSSLMKTSREIFCTCLRYYNPRSLKDLARCKIRANLQTSMTYPEQVHKFDIPISLKKFLLFHKEEILDSLKVSCLSKETQKQLKLRASLMKEIHFYQLL